MNIFKSIVLSKWHRLTDIEKEILKYLFDHKKETNINVLSKETGFSISKITKCCQKLGFEGWKDFYVKYNQEFVKTKDNFEPDAFQKNVYDSYLEILKSFINFKFDNNQIERVVQILETKSIYLFGIGSNKIVFKDFEYRFFKFGKKFITSNDDDELLIKLSSCKEESWLIISSIRATKTIFKNIVLKVKRNPNVKILFLTSNKNISFKNYIDELIFLPQNLKYQSLNSISGQILLLLFIDFISQVYISRNFDEIFTNWKNIKSTLKK